MNILMILTNSFNPDPRVYKEAYTLINNGNDVEIVCWDRDSNLSQLEVHKNGLKIKRFKISSTYGQGLNQLKQYLVFLKKVIEYSKGLKIDILHCHDFDSLYIGYKIKKHNKNLKLVYDEHDIFHLYFKYRRGFIYYVIYITIKNLEKLFLKKVNLHIVVSKRMLDFYPFSKNKILLPNYPLKSQFNILKKRTKNKIVIGFIGSIRYVDELITLIQVSQNFNNIQVSIFGDGVGFTLLKNYVISNKLTNVFLHGKFSFYDLPSLYSEIDITFLVYPVKFSTISLPNKLFESILTNTPIIADLKSEYGQLVNELKIGWTIDSRNLFEELTKLFYLIENKRSIINKFSQSIENIKHNYNWESHSNLLIDSYNKFTV